MTFINKVITRFLNSTKFGHQKLGQFLTYTDGFQPQKISIPKWNKTASVLKTAKQKQVRPKFTLFFSG